MRKFVLIDHSLKRVGGHHYDYAAHVLQAAQKAGLRTVLVTHRSFRPRHFDSAGRVYPLFPHTTYNRFTTYTSSTHSNSLLDRVWRRHFVDGRGRRIWGFANACRRLLRKVALCEGDIVFLPTVSELDLLGLSLALQKCPATRCAAWHLQFHFDIYQGREADWGQQSGRLESVRRNFRQAMQRLSQHRLHFYCTSEQLASQYNGMQLATFYPLAYPINPRLAVGPTVATSQDRRETESADRNPETRIASAAADGLRHTAEPAASGSAGLRNPLRITCAGAVRPEKGQRLLADVRAALWDACFANGQAQLVVQAKLHWLTGRPRWRLSSTDLAACEGHDGAVRYVAHPLPPDDYTQLIRQSDIGLLMYDSQRYYVRRAGVLCEMLAAGVPVIVPAGCWLADQIAEPNFQYVDELAARLTETDQHQFGSLRLAGQRDCSSQQLAVPPGSTQLVVKFQQHEPAGELNRHIRLECCQLGLHDQPVDGTTQIIGRRTTGAAASAVFPLKPGAHKVGLSLRAAYSDRPVRLVNLTLSFLSAGHTPAGSIPLGRVGLAASEPSAVPGLLLDVIRNYEHYRRSATEFAADWFAQHDPQRTIRELQARSRSCLDSIRAA